MSSTQFSPARLDRMRDILNGYVERRNIAGLVSLVSRRGEVHVNTLGNLSLDGDAAVQRDTIFRVASMTKPVTAVAAMILVEECRLRLDDPVDEFLPELADRQVLVEVDGPVDETVPAKRPITLRDLITSRFGLGHLMTASGDLPIQQKCAELGILQGPPRPSATPDPDEWMRRVGQLPLMFQPGERWLYDLSIDVLGVLVARAAGTSLEAFMRERIFEPLGMKDTAFSVPAEKIHRLADSYGTEMGSTELKLYDRATGGEWSRPPAFHSGGGGLVSTADDFLAFGEMMLNGGKHGNERILSRLAVEAMTTDQLRPENKVDCDIFFGEHSSWGLGLGIYTNRDNIGSVPGRFGWDGGLGTSWYVDPKEQLIGILLTQTAWTSPVGPKVWSDFWTCTYAAIDG